MTPVFSHPSIRLRAGEWPDLLGPSAEDFASTEGILRREWIMSDDFSLSPRWLESAPFFLKCFGGREVEGLPCWHSVKWHLATCPSYPTCWPIRMPEFVFSGFSICSNFRHRSMAVPHELLFCSEGRSHAGGVLDHARHSLHARGSGNIRCGCLDC